MATEIRELANLQANPKNPRRVTDAKMNQLGKALRAFGELGGIVHNRKTGRLVGGHQRVAIFRQAPDAQVVVERSYEAPTRTGTLAEGYVKVDGERFAYREVEWSKRDEKAANLAANKSAGEFDFSAVAEWVTELDMGGFDMDLTMFDASDLAAVMTPAPAATDSDWTGALDKVPQGEQGGIRTVTFTLSLEQHTLLTQRLEQMKALGPFVGTGNENSNGNALGRLCEMFRG